MAEDIEMLTKFVEYCDNNLEIVQSALSVKGFSTCFLLSWTEIRINNIIIVAHTQTHTESGAMAAAAAAAEKAQPHIRSTFCRRCRLFLMWTLLRGSTAKRITKKRGKPNYTKHTHIHIRALFILYMSSVDRRRSLKLLPVVSSLSRQIVRCLVKRESKTSYSSFISIHSHPFIHSIEHKPAFGGSIHRLGPFRADVGVVL